MISNIDKANIGDKTLRSINKILSIMKRSQTSISEYETILMSLIEILPSRDAVSQSDVLKELNEKCVRKLIVITL